MAWRIWQWRATPKSPIPLGMFPKPATRAGRIGKMLKDTLIAPQSASIEPKMWLFAMMFHLAALAASEQQAKFGRDKRDTLPRYCLDCPVRFACKCGSRDHEDFTRHRCLRAI